MEFKLKYKDEFESREIPKDDYTIKDLIVDLGMSSQTIVSKQNGELVIEDTIIEEGDKIELIQIIYGG
ncbi:MoaD/ThiS family protein [Methanobrevibacter millerae]|uniref:Sulfur carrier protein n=1 Tax=Methanobrevibacter millerae TaxID=230361 RepID=A0A1G5WQ54_9EURY|nr:MoaD/ThiS family protein [Methanobrevibacter millerae]SDA60319.1 sulfur carrier protein [Methanobrevibacter millerae]